MEAICVFAIYWCRVCGPGVQPNFLINKLSAISANHLLSLFGANHLSTHWFIPNSCQNYINCFETFGKKMQILNFRKQPFLLLVFKPDLL